MILTDNSNYAKNFEASEISVLKKRFIHNDLGWNYRLSNLHAAVGMAQFEKLDKFIKRNVKLVSSIISIQKFNFFDTQPDELNYAKNIYWVYGIVLKKRYLSFKEIIIRELKKMGLKQGLFSIHYIFSQFLKKNINQWQISQFRKFI